MTNDTFQRPFSLRQKLAHAVGLASPILALYVLWQIVPFLRGQITSPLVTAYNRASPLGMKLIGAWDTALGDSHAGIVGFLGYYLIGVASFAAASGLIILAAETVSRILFVGWARFRQEQREAAEDNRQEAIRERRRERRRAALQTRKQNSDTSVWLFVAGAIVFWWML